jgi:adenylate cyclase class IV
MIEIERRYKIASPANIIATLEKQGITQVTQKHIIDQWFIPNSIHSREEHNVWFDEKHGEAYRIRQTEQPNGTFSVTLDSKQHTEANDHNTFQERTIDTVTDIEAAQAFLAEKGYYNWLTIDKRRIAFDAHDPSIEIVLDEIDGLADKIGIGAALELEYTGEKSRHEALQELRDVAMTLGLTDEDLFEKSLTVAAMDVLAQFKD